MDTSTLVGMNKQEARNVIYKAGYVPRVVKEDGKTYSFFELMDDVNTYVNLTVREGMVIKAELAY